MDKPAVHWKADRATLTVHALTQTATAGGAEHLDQSEPRAVEEKKKKTIRGPSQWAALTGAPNLKR